MNGQLPQSDDTTMDIVSRSILTCPECGARTEQEMPQDACLYYFECPACRALLRPKPGDCCVFCSYGSAKCPPVQRRERCCGGAGPGR